MCNKFKMFYQSCGHSFSASQVCVQSPQPSHQAAKEDDVILIEDFGLCGSPDCFTSINMTLLNAFTAALPPFFTSKAEALRMADLIESRAEAFLSSAQPVLDINGKDILSDEAVVSEITGYVHIEAIKAFKVVKLALQISWVEKGAIRPGKTTELYRFLTRLDAHNKFMYKATQRPSDQEDLDLPPLVSFTSAEDIAQYKACGACGKDYRTSSNIEHHALRHAYTVNPCGHTFCELCISTGIMGIADVSCPVCGTDFDPNEYEFPKVYVPSGELKALGDAMCELVKLPEQI